MPFAPTSVKRPHWVLLGFHTHLRVPGVQRHTVLGSRLVSYTTADATVDELFVTEASCPHRGASLAGGTVRDGCIACPFHGKALGPATHPHRFYDYAALQGLVWIDFARDLITQHHMPPYATEFSSADYETTEHATPLRAHPIVLVEHLVNPWRLVHADLERVGQRGQGRAALDTPHGPVSLVTEVHAPYTVAHKFADAGHVQLLVWFSVTPTRPGRCTLHTRVARRLATARPEAVDWLASRVREWEDANVASTVDVAAWASNRLDDADGLVRTYRDVLRAQFHDLADALVSDL